MAFSIALGGSIYRTRWLYHPHRWLNLFAILKNLTFAKAVLIFIVGGTLLIDFCGSFSMAYYMGNSWLNGLKMTLAFVPLDTVKAILAAWITLRLKKRYSLISLKLA